MRRHVAHSLVARLSGHQALSFSALFTYAAHPNFL